MTSSPEEEYPTDMDGLLRALSDARSLLVSVIDNRSEEELTELSDAGGWSVKDHLYHLAIWNRGVRYLLEGRPLHEGVELTAEQYRDLDVDSQNEIAVARSRERSLNDVVQTLETEHQRLVDCLTSPAITWDDLQKPVEHYAPGDPIEDGDAPMLVLVFNETVGHCELHREWIEEILR